MFGGFGQQQQQQQQQPLGGGFGTASSFGGFGGIGAQQQNTSPFGAAAATGFGQPAATSTAFGGTGAGGTFGAQIQANSIGFGTGSAFGATQPTAGGFGSTVKPSGFGTSSTTGFGFTGAAATPSGFGAPSAATGGIFGQKPTTSAFGATNFSSTTAVGGGTGGGFFGASSAQPPATGTTQPPFSVFQDRDAQGNLTLFQTITALPAYRNFSVEELRWVDYQNGRKNATQQGFGQTTTSFGTKPSMGFGQTPQTQGGGLFGSNTTATGGFGAATGGFGQAATTGTGFGQTPATTGSAFGQPTGTTGGGFGGFGSTSTNTSAFGQKPATSAFGLGTTGGFGTQTSAFGQQQPQQTDLSKATGGFGGFGQPTQPATTGFGAATAQQPSLFGGGVGGGFGQGQTSLFGGGAGAQAQQAKPTSTFFGAGGVDTTAKPMGFGTGATTFNLGGGVTGGAQSTGGMFGGQTPATTSNFFGNQNPPSSGFGGQSTLFGSGGFGTTPGQSTAFATPNTQLNFNSNIPITSLTASIDQAAYNNVLFGSSAATPSTAAVVASNAAKAEESEKKPADIPYHRTTPSSVHRLKLRGFSSTKSPSPAHSSMNDPEIYSPLSSVKKLTIDSARLNLSPALPASSSTSALASSKQEDVYWMNPSYDKLKDMTKEELKAVSDFVVGRHGHGQVRFLKPVDLTTVSSLNAIVGGLVTFSKCSCTVYPDDVTKPEPGNGLNVPAIITLEGVWVLDKATREPVRDPSDPRFQQKLQRLKSTKDTEFIEYIADTGVWVFKVDHFTTYGVNEDDEDEEMIEKEPCKKLKSSKLVKIFKNPNEEIQLTMLNKSAEVYLQQQQFQDQEEEEEEEEDQDSMMLEIPVEHEPQQFPVQISESRESPEADKNLTIIDAKKYEEPVLFNRFALFQDAPVQSSPLGIGTTDSKVDPPQGEVQMDSVVRKGPSFLMRRPLKYSRVEFQRSVSFNYSNVVTDAGLSMGRSFRAGWGPRGQLAHSGSSTSGDQDFNISISNDIYTEDIKKAVPLLELIKNHSVLKLDVYGFPEALIDSSASIRFCHFVSLEGLAEEEVRMYKLCQLLFDPLTGTGYDSREHEMKRKAELSEWLREAVSSVVEAEANGHLFKEQLHEAMFAYFSGNQMKKACQIALKNKEYRLATILSQISGDVQFRQDLMDQVEAWKDLDQFRHIPEVLRKIYESLGGKIGLSECSKGGKNINILDGLDWKRCFGMCLWYGTPRDSRISDAVEVYEHTITSFKKTPKFKISIPVKHAFVGDFAKYPAIVDVTYHLIQLCIRKDYLLEDVLLGVFADYKNDRICWVLLIMLGNVLRVRDLLDRDETSTQPGQRFYDLCFSFSQQLENAGLWQWSVFILLFLSNSNCRKTAVNEIVQRNVCLSITLSEEETFINQQLGIPTSIIYNAKAQLAGYQGKKQLRVRLLILAEAWNEAHSTIVEDIAPTWILRGRYRELQELLLQLDFNHCQGWEQGGQLFLEYISLNQGIGRIVSLSATDATDATEMEEKKKEFIIRLEQALTNTTNRPKRQLVQDVVYSEMAGRLGNMIFHLGSRNYAMTVNQAPKETCLRNISVLAEKLLPLSVN